MPNVKVGSVFEISYSYQGIPNSYTIQRGIPVAYSALLFQEHPDLDVRITEIIPYGFSYKSNGTYIAKNVPAFKHEPFITSENDYQLGLEIELIQIRGIIMSYFGRTTPCLLHLGTELQNDFLVTQILVPS